MFITIYDIIDLLMICVYNNFVVQSNNCSFSTNLFYLYFSFNHLSFIIKYYNEKIAQRKDKVFIMIKGSMQRCSFSTFCSTYNCTCIVHRFNGHSMINCDYINWFCNNVALFYGRINLVFIVL